MLQTSNLYEDKLREAAEYLSAGQKKNARRVIRDVLLADENNLKAWELLYRASYSSHEQIICLNHILQLQPDHPWARQQLAFIKTVNIDDELGNSRLESYSLNSSTSTRRLKKKSQEPLLIWAGIMVGLLSVICIATWALAAYRIGGIFPGFTTNGTATAFAANQASCQALIEQAMKASGEFCSQIGPNRVCYGNNTVKAELASNSGQSFSKRGDIVNVIELKRLSASPLSTENNEWGIAVFQIQANLPRSLPGEMIKMVVFGNTSLIKDGGNLQSFYFSSDLGQLVCEKLPYDGLMVTMPDGTGVKFTVNGAEMILMGNASFKATKNDTMQVSMFSGSARVRSAGHDRYFGAGQKVFVRLGGKDGTDAIGEPSDPQPLSAAEYSVACALTGKYCSQNEIKPLSFEQIREQILVGLGIQSVFTETPTNTATPRPTATAVPTMTSVPSLTPIRVFTSTPTKTKIPPATPTRTPLPRTATSTTTVPTATKVKSTATFGPSPTATLTPTTTNTPTITLTPSLTFTPTLTNTPLPTSTPPTAAVCGDVTTGGLTNAGSELDMNISNSHGSPVSIASVHAVWVKNASSQKLVRILFNGDTSWNTSDPTPPSDIPSESDWKAGAILTIPDATTWPFAAQFQDPLEPGDYSIAIVLDIGCQVRATIAVP